MTGDLPDELRALITAERSAPVADVATQQLVRAKLSTTLGIAPAAGTAASSLAIKLLGIVLGIVGLTAIGSVVARDTDPVPAPVLAYSMSPPIEPAGREIVLEPPVVGITEAAPREAARVRQPARVVARPQIELLAEATRALTDGDAHRVLALVDEDLRAHRDGPLAEEREALRLSALLSLDRNAEARQTAMRLLTRYPHTSHRTLVDRALTTETP